MTDHPAITRRTGLLGMGALLGAPILAVPRIARCREGLSPRYVCAYISGSGSGLCPRAIDAVVAGLRGPLSRCQVATGSTGRRPPRRGGPDQTTHNEV